VAKDHITGIHCDDFATHLRRRLFCVDANASSLAAAQLHHGQVFRSTLRGVTLRQEVTTFLGVHENAKAVKNRQHPASSSCMGVKAGSELSRMKTED
jgi:hypothetical protein